MNVNPSSINLLNPLPLDQAPHPTSSPSANQEKSRSLLEKIWSVVKTIFKGIAAAALFVVTPALFAVGFIIGLVWDKKVQETVDKIILVWKKQTWLAIVIAGAAAFLALPITLSAASFLAGAKLGSHISLSAQEKE